MTDFKYELGTALNIALAIIFICLGINSIEKIIWIYYLPTLGVYAKNDWFTSIFIKYKYRMNIGDNTPSRVRIIYEIIIRKSD